MAFPSLSYLKRRFRFVGEAPCFEHTIKMAAQVAATGLSVLITGENGSGKEAIARMIHELSPRKHRNLISVNCGALPPGTLDAELFGHAKGAFTGAGEARKGHFEMAHEGTLFLDEIGELPMVAQPRLLRILESNDFLRVGSSKATKVDVRLVTATNVDLLEAIARSKFREDLYYRIAQVTIAVPPLRKRKKDVILLWNKFALDIAESNQKDPVILSQEAKQLLCDYPFPGNIRQLKNIVWQVATLEGHGPISTNQLARYLTRFPTFKPPILSSSEPPLLEERALIYQLLMEMRGDIDGIKKLLQELLGEHPQRERYLANHPWLLTSKSAPPLPPSKIRSGLELPAAVSAKEVKPLPSLEAQERVLIERALKDHQNRKEAAQHLGIAERTLYRKIKAYGL